MKPVFSPVFYTVTGKDRVGSPARDHLGAGRDHRLLIAGQRQGGGAWIMGAGTSGAHIMTPGS